MDVRDDLVSGLCYKRPEKSPNVSHRSVYILVGFEGSNTAHGLFSSYHTILKLCIWIMGVIISIIRTPQRPLRRG